MDLGRLAQEVFEDEDATGATRAVRILFDLCSGGCPQLLGAVAASFTPEPAQSCKRSARDHALASALGCRRASRQESGQDDAPGARTTGTGVDVRRPRFTQIRVVFYGVVSFETEKVVQFFPTRAEAEAMIAGVLEDAPELAEVLAVVPVEFSTEPN